MKEPNWELPATGLGTTFGYFFWYGMYCFILRSRRLPQGDLILMVDRLSRPCRTKTRSILRQIRGAKVGESEIGDSATNSLAQKPAMVLNRSWIRHCACSLWRNWTESIISDKPGDFLSNSCGIPSFGNAKLPRVNMSSRGDAGFCFPENWSLPLC